MPLAGGTAVTLTQQPRLIGDLDTDGSSLYWKDSAGLRKMPIGGGAITTLVTSSNLGPFGLDATRVFYSDGMFVRSVLKTGGQSTIYAVESSPVSAMYIHRGAAGTTIHWGVQNGFVESYTVGGSYGIHQQLTGRPVVSVYYDGSRVLWIDCLSGNTGCALRVHPEGSTTTVHTGGVGSSFVQGDAARIFWGDATAVRRYAY